MKLIGGGGGGGGGGGVGGGGGGRAGGYKMMPGEPGSAGLARATRAAMRHCLYLEVTAVAAVTARPP